MVSAQVDNFLQEERRSIDEAEDYLMERSALADRNKNVVAETLLDKDGNREDDARSPP